MSGPGLLLMAYGTPAGPDDVERYYTHVRNGHPPAPALLEELAARYASIGGTSPLLDISRRQASALEAALGIPVSLGMKHASPFLEDALDDLVGAGVDQVVGLVLAPHYSEMSVGQYESRVTARLQPGPPVAFHMIRSWHKAPGYLSLMARRVLEALARVPKGLLHRAEVVFTAHSLPEKILAGGDPYATQLEETARSVAVLARLPRWSTAWQSAGRTEDAWLGPDLLDVLRQTASRGTDAVVVCPCGFVADHLEVLYDVDVEARAVADELGVSLVRTASPNDDPLFVSALADVVRRELVRLPPATACGCAGGCRVLEAMETALDRGGM